MKKGLGAAVVLALASVALWFYFNGQNPKSPDGPSALNGPAGQRSLSSPASAPAELSTISNANPADSKAEATQRAASPPQVVEAATTTNLTPDLPPVTVLQNVRRSIHQYGAMFGGNPVGTNPEITRQLSGENPKHINFIDPQAGMRVNSNGELIDPWGTPYFFHQLSATDMEIHAAGPDKLMWTSDDLVIK